MITNCLDCDYHLRIDDSDPDDWFNYDDEAVVCTLIPNPHIDENSAYRSDYSLYKSITKSCRPHHVRKECDIPDWCPKKV